MTLEQPYDANARSALGTSLPKWNSKEPRSPSRLRAQASNAPPTILKDGPGDRFKKSVGKVKTDAVTPAKAFLGTNITPRSGSRKARVESASSTPKGTPDGSSPSTRPTSMIEGRDWPSGGLQPQNALGQRGGNSSRPARAQSAACESHTGYDDAGTNADISGVRPKFFHATDAKPASATRPQSQSPLVRPKEAGFHQSASDISIEAKSFEPLNTGAEEVKPKFFYADNIRESKSPSPRSMNGAFSVRPPLHTIFSSHQSPTVAAVTRPPSPLKDSITPVSRKASLTKASPRRHTRLVSSGSSNIRAPDGSAFLQMNLSRQSSLNQPERRTSQPQSPNSTNFGFDKPRRPSIVSSDLGKQSETKAPPEGTFPSSPSQESAITQSPETLQPQSPSKQEHGQSKLDHLNELAANARRERKVLDLEISNSSLLAINRTLETEMRKQKAELRHLRRLRSSGRFPSSSRSASSKLSMLSTTDDLSPTSSTDEVDDEDEVFSNLSAATSDDTSFPDSSSFSPTFRMSTASDPKSTGLIRSHRQFKLDLSAQRALLLDSQKLNQALKRCLGRTDEMISEGKRALEYKAEVGPGETLGPRVLTPDERAWDAEMGRGLLSPSLDPEKMGNPWERVRTVGEMWTAPKDVDTSQEQITKESIDKGIRGSEASMDVDTLNIPYEDPGIDTGRESSAVEDSVVREVQSIAIDTDSTADDTASTTALSEQAQSVQEEPRTSTKLVRTESSGSGPTSNSPGKGLGDFLRMVGGSWGVQ